MSRIEDEPVGERTPLLQSPTPRELTESCNMSGRSWRDTSSFLARQSYYSTLSTQLSQSGIIGFYFLNQKYSWFEHYSDVFSFHKQDFYLERRTFRLLSQFSNRKSFWACFLASLKYKNPFKRPLTDRTSTRTSTIPRSSHCDKGTATRFSGSNSST